jgi:beta-fructofuranosidase
VLWGWIPETRPESEFVKSGWAGSTGLPRILTVGPDNELDIVPLPELHSLRRAQSKTDSFSAYRGEAIVTVVRPRGGEAVMVGPQHTPYVTIEFAATESPRILIDGRSEPWKPANGGLSIHVFMDGSVIEVFINKTIAYTKRCYDLDHTEPVTRVTTRGSVDSLQVWECNPISKNRLTT